MQPHAALSALMSFLHLMALAIGLPAVFLRARALRGALDAAGVRRVLAADTAWGIAALLWLVTGPWRAFGGLEKGTAFYLSSHLFHIKLELFVLALALEVWPMVAFIRWRIALARGRAPDTARARTFATVSEIETGLVLAIALTAAFMARGFGLPAE